MKALVNTRCNDQSVQLISIMCLCTRVHLSWNMCIISRQGGEEKSIKGNIPIGFSLCHRPVSAGPMHRSRAQQHVDDLLTSTRGQRFGGHSGYIRGLPGTQITDWMREKKKKEKWSKTGLRETSWNKHSGSFGFGSFECFTGFDYVVVVCSGLSFTSFWWTGLLQIQHHVVFQYFQHN